MEMNSDEIYSNIVSLLVDSLAHQRACAEVFSNYLAGDDKIKSREIMTAIDKSSSVHRQTLIDLMSKPIK